MTHRVGAGDRLVVATHNPGKLVEIAELVAPFGVVTVGAGALGLPEPDETGDSFIANAALKARAAATATGLAALADDSGLEVPALGGAPGLEAATWAGPRRDFQLAMRKLARALGAADDRRATFVCALVLAWPDGATLAFEGRIAGQLVWPPRGANGFGYDPMFVADGHTLTFGELTPAEKHADNHRARAFAKLAAHLGG